MNQPMTTTPSSQTVASLRREFEAARDLGYSGRAALQKIATRHGITVDAAHSLIFGARDATTSA